MGFASAVLVTLNAGGLSNQKEIALETILKGASVSRISEQSQGRKRWVKLTPRDHVLKQIEIHRELVEGLRTQLKKEEQTLEGLRKAKAFFPL